MNASVIIAVANAVTTNAEVLKSLIDARPRETRVAVEEKVVKATTKKSPTASQENTTPVVDQNTTPPVVETTTAAVVETTMPAAPVPTVAAQAPANPAPTPVAPATVTPPVVSAPVAPVMASPSNVPFNDHKALLAYVMSSYQSLGSEKGAKIQEVLNGLGVHNINDVKPEHYAALYAGVEALKNG